VQKPTKQRKNVKKCIERSDYTSVNIFLVENLREKLSIVVGVFFGQFSSPVVQEIGQSGVSVGGDADFIVVRPHDDSDQGDEYVQRRIQLRI